jgi:hypothetical protein
MLRVARAMAAEISAFAETSAKSKASVADPRQVRRDEACLNGIIFLCAILLTELFIGISRG